MFNRIRETAQQISSTGASVEQTAQLITSLILDIMENGIDLSLKIGDKEIPVSLHIKVPEDTQ